CRSRGRSSLFLQAEDGIRYGHVTGVQTCALPISDWLEQWLRDYVQNFVAQTTYERYRGIVRTYVIPQLGRKTLEQLTPPHIQRYYTHLKESGFSSSTIGLHHTVLYHSLRDAKRAGLVGRNVV